MGVFANVVIEIAVILMPLFVIKRGVEEKKPPLEIVYTAIISTFALVVIVAVLFLGSGKFNVDSLVTQYADVVKNSKGSDSLKFFANGTLVTAKDPEGINLFVKTLIYALPAAILGIIIFLTLIEYRFIRNVALRRGIDVPMMPKIRDFSLPNGATITAGILLALVYILPMAVEGFSKDIEFVVVPLIKTAFAFQGAGLAIRVLARDPDREKLAKFAVLVMIITTVGVSILAFIGLLDGAFGIKDRMRKKGR